MNGRLPLSLLDIVLFAPCLFATTIDESVTYDVTCEVFTDCGQQLVVVDGASGPTTLTFVDPARNEIEGVNLPAVVVNEFRRVHPIVAVTGRSIAIIEGGVISAGLPVSPAIVAIDEATVNVTKGRIGGPNGIEAYGSSRVRLSEGVIDAGNSFDFVPTGALVLDDNAVGEITGGDVNSDGYSVSTLGNSRLTIHGGSFRGWGLFSDDTSVMDVFGGSYSNSICFGACPFFLASGDSRINIHGGDFRPDPTQGVSAPEFETLENGEIHVFGRGLMLTELRRNNFQLTGTLSDGMPVDFPVRGNIILHNIPEPSSAILAIIALLFLGTRTFSAFGRRTLEY